jgi:ABC-type enterochelin transport system permease subunit
MNKTAKNAIVTGRLLLAAILVVIRWAVFEPVYFIGLIVYTIGEAGKDLVTNYTSWAKIENEKILK